MGKVAVADVALLALSRFLYVSRCPVVSALLQAVLQALDHLVLLDQHALQLLLVLLFLVLDLLLQVLVHFPQFRYLLVVGVD